MRSGTSRRICPRIEQSGGLKRFSNIYRLAIRFDGNDSAFGVQGREMTEFVTTSGSEQSNGEADSPGGVATARPENRFGNEIAADGGHGSTAEVTFLMSAVPYPVAIGGLMAANSVI